MELPLFSPLIYMGLGCGNVSGSHFRAAGCLCLFSPAIQCRPLRPARPQPLICNAERASRASLCLSSSPCPHFGWQGGMPCPSTPGKGHALSSQCPVAFSSWLLRLPPPSLAPRGPSDSRGPRLWVMVKQQVMGFVIHSDSARPTHPCPSPAPLQILPSEHPGLCGGCWG